jgi:hypothetical protein
MQHRASHGIGVIACLSLAITAACREVDVVAADVARIEIEPTEVELRPGQVRQFTVVLTSEEGDRLAGRTIEWASADPDVATVDADGRVEARGTGETHISARVENAAGTAVVRVHSPPPPPPPPPPAATPPRAPSQLTASAKGEDRILLQWKDNSDDETHFVVERKSRKDGAWKHVAELPANTSTHMDRGLEEETRYWYRVLACRDSRCAASGEVSERTKDD